MINGVCVCACACVFVCVFVHALQRELEEGMMINDEADLEKDRLPVGQMTGDGGLGGGTEWRGGQGYRTLSFWQMAVEC